MLPTCTIVASLNDHLASKLLGSIQLYRFVGPTYWAGVSRVEYLGVPISVIGK